MRAIYFDNGLSFNPRQAEPPAFEGDALVRVRLAGIAAADLETARRPGGYAGILGQEFVGEVARSSKKELEGRRVVGEINIACGRCDLCLSGLSGHCRNRQVLGMEGHNGVFADYVRLPVENLHVVPEGVEDEQAVFVEPLAAAFQILKQMKLDGRNWVTVLGDGRFGLLAAQVLRNAGCPVRVIGRHPQKMRLCEKWSIRSRPIGEIVPRHDQDVVVDCTGSMKGLEAAIQMVRPRGTIILKSRPAEGALDLRPLVRDEIQVIGSRSGPFREAIAALAQKSVDVTSLIFRRMKLEQGVEAMQLAARPGVLKVLLAM